MRNPFGIRCSLEKKNRNVLLSKNNHNGTPASPVSKYAYQTNDIGQRTDLTATGSAFGTAPVYKWKYNGAGELAEADDTASANDRAYQYDGIGNRQKTVNGLLGALPATPNYVANSKNQYTTANGVALPTTPAPAPYDEDGNMTRGPLPASDTGTNATLVWDAENRLVSVTITKGGSTITVNCSYDAQSRRTEKTTVGSISTLYVYDGWNLVAEYAGTSLSKSYTWGMDLSGSMQGAGGVGGLLNVELHTGSNTGVYYPTYDGNGNVSEYLDNTGAVVAHYEYDAFGNEITPTAQKGTQHGDFNHRFSTKYIDEETGLYYYGYRYYDATVGRWINRDPIQERGGFNLYGFVRNDGVGKWDYLGMEAGLVCSGLFGNKGSTEVVDDIDKFLEESGWPEALQDLYRWLVDNPPTDTHYAAGTPESQLIRKSANGKKLMDGYKNKFKGKKCSEWGDYTNVKLNFGVKEFLCDLPNGRSHFVGSGRGDAYTNFELGSEDDDGEEVPCKCYVSATFTITNTTSLKSALYHILPDSWNRKGGGKIAANWTQTYTWDEIFECVCDDE